MHIWEGNMIRAGLLLAMMVAVPAAWAQQSDEATIADARIAADGMLSHSVRSPRQREATEIRVLLPDKLDAAKRYPVLYVLPVEAARGTRWGDGLIEAKRLGLQNRFQLICVAPTFADLPWYADHPTDERLRQESYLLRDVVPFVDANYPVVPGASGRLLVGFSKSGWGAFSLLLRNPSVFAKAAAWDAPLNMQAPDKYGMGPIFGTQENFERYQITRLLPERAAELRAEPRLFHLGYDNFREHHAAIEAILMARNIAHGYRDGPKRKHIWESGWLSQAVELLVASTVESKEATR
jgi:enterochelin esterase-like enzyme